MARRHALLFFILIFVFAVPVAAQDGPLRSFAPLIGGAWVADGEQSALGKYRAVRTYEAALGGRYIRVRQTLTLPEGNVVEEETLIGWDPGRERYTLWGFASDGSRTDAVGLATGENRFVFTGQTYGARSGDWRMTTFIIDESAMSVLLEVKSRAEFEPVMTLAFRRTEGGT